MLRNTQAGVAGKANHSAPVRHALLAGHHQSLSKTARQRLQNRPIQRILNDNGRGIPVSSDTSNKLFLRTVRQTARLSPQVVQIEMRRRVRLRLEFG